MLLSLVSMLWCIQLATTLPMMDKSKNSIKKLDSKPDTILDNMTDLKFVSTEPTVRRKNNELLKHGLTADYDQYYDDYEAPIITIRFKRETAAEDNTEEKVNEDSEAKVDETSNDTSASRTESHKNVAENEKNMLLKRNSNANKGIRDNGTNASPNNKRKGRNGRKKSNRSLRKSLRRRRRRLQNKI